METLFSWLGPIMIGAGFMGMLFENKLKKEKKDANYYFTQLTDRQAEVELLRTQLQACQHPYAVGFTISDLHWTKKHFNLTNDQAACLILLRRTTSYERAEEYLTTIQVLSVL